MNFSLELRRPIEMQPDMRKAVSSRRRLGTSLLFAVLFMPQAVPARAQERIDTHPLCGDSKTVAQPGENASTPAAPAPQAPAPTAREATLRTLPRNFLQDQKDLWLFPVKLAHGHHWLPTALIVGATAGLIASDPETMPHFRQTNAFSGFNSVFSGTTGAGIIVAIPATFYVASLIRKNSYDQSSALLAGEAVADDAVLMVIMKSITIRQRPDELAVNGNYSDTFFESHKSFLGTGSSFPSGHAMMSFSVATVFARRYRRHRWVPYVAYGLASVISFSRVTTGAHFPSDVFLGAALGYAIARFDVVRQ
ncbi:MAG: phosphatase PAP2 family protein [Candidatus Acidiferrales bacterium]